MVILDNYITVVNQDLKDIEKNINHMIIQARIQGVNLYNEMKKISESSYVQLPDRKTKTQKLKLEIPQELDQFVEDRIRNYVNYCITILRGEFAGKDAPAQDIRKKIQVLLSDRELLNHTIDQTKIDVKLYKVDINPKNSGLKLWEDTMVQNSGGEKFVACFTLISSLIGYTRTKMLEERGETNKYDSRVFIIDNPFGRTSSKHLLEVMVEIARKFNTQLICLSDISQSSITDQFTLIYQLAVRNALYSNKSYLKVEDVKINGEITRNSRLEHAVLRNEQITLFEMGM